MAVHSAKPPREAEIVLRASDYGKSDIRLVKVLRDQERHELRDLRVDVSLEGDFDRCYLDGDNGGVLATDTMRNTVYALAKDHLTGAAEEFARALCRHFLASSPLVRSARVRISEHPWERLRTADGQEHPHAFQRGHGGERVAVVKASARACHTSAGIEDLLVLKTTGAGWEGFLRERYTTLAETRDRILATIVSASWDYAAGELEFDRLWEGVRARLLEAFADHYSPSVQYTLHRMGRAVLEAHPEVIRIRLSLPNKHHLLYDLERFGIANPGEIFHASAEPYGLIEGTVERS
jgi:urate oxidase